MPSGGWINAFVSASLSRHGRAGAFLGAAGALRLAGLPLHEARGGESFVPPVLSSIKAVVTGRLAPPPWPRGTHRADHQLPTGAPPVPSLRGSGRGGQVARLLSPLNPTCLIVSCRPCPSSTLPSTLSSRAYSRGCQGRCSLSSTTRSRRGGRRSSGRGWRGVLTG
jgi:hypothetical protein